MIVVSCPDCGKPLLWHLAHEHRCDKQPRKSKPPMVRCAMCDESYPLHLAREHKCAQKSSPAKKPTTSPVTKTVASKSISPSIRRTVDPPESVRPPQSNALDHKHLTVRPQATNDFSFCPTCGHRVRIFDKTAYQRAYMRAYRARQKAAE